MSFITGYSANLPADGNVNFGGSNVTLGSVSKLHITGGTNQRMLTTDGSNNVSWSVVSPQVPSSVVLSFTFSGNVANGTADTTAQSEIITYTMSTSPAFTPVASANVWTGSATSVTTLPSATVIRYLNGLYVAVTGQTKTGLIIYTSVDGYTWMANTSLQGVAAFGATVGVPAIGYGPLPRSSGGGNGYVVVAADQTNAKTWIAYSRDLTTWTTIQLQALAINATAAGDIVYDVGSSQWIAVWSPFAAGAYVSSSSDASFWATPSQIATGTSRVAPNIRIAIYGTTIVVGANTTSVYKNLTSSLRSAWTLVNNFVSYTVTYQNGYFVAPSSNATPTSAVAYISTDGTTWSATSSAIGANAATGAMFISSANVWIFTGTNGIYSSPPFANGAPGNGAATLITASDYGTTVGAMLNSYGNGFIAGNTTAGIRNFTYAQTQTQYTIGLPATTLNGVYTPAANLTFAPTVGGNYTVWSGQLANLISNARPTYTVAISGGSNNIVTVNSNANVDFGGYSNSNIALTGAPPSSGTFVAAQTQAGSSGRTGNRDTVTFTDPTTSRSWSFQPEFGTSLQNVANIAAQYLNSQIPSWSGNANAISYANAMRATDAIPGVVSLSTYLTCSILRGNRAGQATGFLSVNNNNTGAGNGTYSNSVGTILTPGYNSTYYIVNGNSNVSIPLVNGNINWSANGVANVLQIRKPGAVSYVTLDVSNVSLGINAGVGQGANSIAIGQNAATNTQGADSIAIGLNAAANRQGSNSIAIGANLLIGNATVNQAANAIAIGNGSFSNTGNIGSQADGAISIGSNSFTGLATANQFQAANAIAIGYSIMSFSATATFGQQANAIAIGATAHNLGSGTDAIGIGFSSLSGISTFSGGGSNSIGIGAYGAIGALGPGSVGIGYYNMSTTVSSAYGNIVAIGANAGTGGPGSNSVLIGSQANTSGNSSVSIGRFVGNSNTTSNSVYIGANAAANGGSFANVIVLNSTGANFNPGAANGMYISNNSVRAANSGSWSAPSVGLNANVLTTSQLLCYSPTTGEVIGVPMAPVRFVAGQFGANTFNTAVSYDGISWVAGPNVAPAGPLSFYGIGANGTFIFNNGATKTPTSSWTSITSQLSGLKLTSLFAYGNGTWMYVGTESANTQNTYSYTSSDGLTWTATGRMPQTGGAYVALTFCNDRFIACGNINDNTSTSNSVFSTDNGVTWSANINMGGFVVGNVNTATGLINMTSDRSNTIIVTQSSTNRASVSSDRGNTWANVTLPWTQNAGYPCRVQYGNSRWLGMKENGTNSNVFASTDAINWTDIGQPFGTAGARGFGYSRALDRWVIIGIWGNNPNGGTTHGQSFYSNDDGATWTQSPTSIVGYTNNWTPLAVDAS